MKKEDIEIGSVVEMRNAYQNFYYKVLELFDERAKVMTEDGVRFYRYEDFHGVSDSFDFSKVVIDKDNITLYYEFMSDEDLIEHKNAQIVVPLLTTRFFEAFKSLNIDIDNNDTYDNIITNHIVNTIGCGDNDYVIRQTMFGIKDTLKPIDEYIEDIKASSEYKEYILSLYSHHYDSDEDITEFSFNDELIFERGGCLDADECQDIIKEYIENLDTVQCNMCGWSGKEEDLEYFGTGEDSFKGCKGCETDAYLMEISTK